MSTRRWNDKKSIAERATRKERSRRRGAAAALNPSMNYPNLRHISEREKTMKRMGSVPLHLRSLILSYSHHPLNIRGVGRGLEAADLPDRSELITMLLSEGRRRNQRRSRKSQRKKKGKRGGGRRRR